MTNPYNRTIYSDKTYWDIRPRGHYQGCHISKINVNREQITPKPIEHRDFSDCYEVDAEDCDFEVGLKSNLMHFWYVQLQPLAECTVRINLLCDT